MAQFRIEKSVATKVMEMKFLQNMKVNLTLKMFIAVGDLTIKYVP